MVDGADEQISRLRSQKANSALAKLVNEASNTIFIRMRDRNYPALVKILIGLQDNIEEWQQQLGKTSNATELEKQMKRAQKEIDKCFKELMKNFDQLYKFCFELRRQDNEDDHYTTVFLDDRIKNEMILNIIHSNFFK